MAQKVNPTTKKTSTIQQVTPQVQAEQGQSDLGFGFAQVLEQFAGGAKLDVRKGQLPSAPSQIAAKVNAKAQIALVATKPSSSSTSSNKIQNKQRADAQTVNDDSTPQTSSQPNRQSSQEQAAPETEQTSTPQVPTTQTPVDSQQTSNSIAAAQAQPTQQDTKADSQGDDNQSQDSTEVAASAQSAQAQDASTQAATEATDAETAATQDLTAEQAAATVVGQEAQVQDSEQPATQILGVVVGKDGQIKSQDAGTEDLSALQGDTQTDPGSAQQAAPTDLLRAQAAVQPTVSDAGVKAKAVSAAAPHLANIESDQVSADMAQALDGSKITQVATQASQEKPLTQQAIPEVTELGHADSSHQTAVIDNRIQGQSPQAVVSPWIAVDVAAEALKALTNISTPDRQVSNLGQMLKSVGADSSTIKALGGAEKVSTQGSVQSQQNSQSSNVGAEAANLRKLDSVRQDSAHATVRQISSSLSTSTMERVEAVLKEAAKSRDGNTISLRLDPPSLGSLKVDVSLRDGSLHARLVAEVPAVNQMLRDRAHELQAILRSVGLDVDSVSVSVGSGQEQTDMFQQFMTGGSNEQGAGRDGSARGDASNKDVSAAAISSLGANVADANLDHWVA